MTSTLDSLAQTMTTSHPETIGPIDVFRAGEFTDASGKMRTISLEDLHAIANSYDPVAHPAPVVIGHPSTDDPAFGWIDRFWVENNVLKATIRDAATEFVDLVKAGRYKRVSISLFPPNSRNNPVPGRFYARHVGFLGAAAPAVPGWTRSGKGPRRVQRPPLHRRSGRAERAWRGLRN